VRAVDRRPALNDWISSPAGANSPHQLLGRPSREVLTNSSSLERRNGSVANRIRNFRAARETRRNGQADTDRVVDLMGDAGRPGRPVLRGAFGRPIRFCCAVVEFEHALFGLFLRVRSSSSVLRLAIGVFAEHCRPPRAMRRPVLGGGSLHRCDRNCPRRSRASPAMIAATAAGSRARSAPRRTG